MRLLSANNLLSNKPTSPFNRPLKHNPKLLSSPPLSLKPRPSSSPLTKPSPISSSLSSSPATATTTPKSPRPLSNWPEFAERVSGEWDGFEASFTAGGSPVELPENVVPAAYREWEVQVFDWQTQCPTLAVPGENGGPPTLSYSLIRLLPTVGCEADAATRHSVEEKVAGGAGSGAVGVGYDERGSYVAVWKGRGLEVEVCLVDPRDREARVRVVMAVAGGLKGVRVFSEYWDGPWRNGESMGGCAIRESGFALSERVEVGDVVGVWEGRRLGVAIFGSDAEDEVFYELREEKIQKIVRDLEGIIALPKNLWCSLQEKEGGEIWAEVGWLLDRGLAMTSRCVLLKDGMLKEMAIGEETALN